MSLAKIARTCSLMGRLDGLTSAPFAPPPQPAAGACVESRLALLAYTTGYQAGALIAHTTNVN